MKIKQQKQIQDFLTKEFEENQAILLYKKESTILNDVINQLNGKSKTQRKTLINTILPRIALYKCIIKECGKDNAYSLVQKYMLEVVAKKSHKSIVKMEKIPGFYTIYSKAFLHIMRTTDLQKSKQHKEKNNYDVTITKCLWHSACVEFGCSELCRLFCDVDDVTYGNLRKIGFKRTQTLGYDGECCDFHFYKK